MSRSRLAHEDVQAIIDELIDTDINVTYRAVARQLNMATSSVTRSLERKALVTAGQERQHALREWRQRAGKKSHARLTEQLAEKDREIERLRGQIQLLQASHQALVRAVGEVGGMDAWQRFFEDYEGIKQSLATLTQE